MRLLPTPILFLLTLCAIGLCTGCDRTTSEPLSQNKDVDPGLKYAVSYPYAGGQATSYVRGYRVDARGCAHLPVDQPGRDSMVVCGSFFVEQVQP